MHLLTIKMNMKNISMTLICCTMLLLTSCYGPRTAGNSGKVPPGQAKKGTGSKSAKPFAPGQQRRN